MMEYNKNKTQAVSYEYWEGLIFQYFKLMEVPAKDLQKEDLIDLYHQDMTVKEAYYHIRLSTIKSAEIIASWQDHFGFEQVHFSSNEAIRRFYKQNPMLKKNMD